MACALASHWQKRLNSVFPARRSHVVVAHTSTFENRLPLPKKITKSYDLDGMMALLDGLFKVS
jgi:hypothetical protein